MMLKMNTMKKIAFVLVLGLIGTLLMFSCSMQQPSERSGELQFQFSTAEQMGVLYNMEDADTVIVSIHDSGGPVHTDLELTLYGMGGSYVSEVVVLPAGDYTLEKFWVMDNDMVPPEAIFVTPEEAAPLAYLVNDPVPIDFSVAADDVTTLSPEVLDTEGFTPEDFGYVSLEPNIVETFSFLISVLIQSGVGYELTDAALTITSGSVLLYDKTIPAETTQIVVQDGYPSYDLLVEKAGYVSYQQTFTDTELKGYTTTPLMITLREISISVIYVDWEATGNNDGTSWENAFTELYNIIQISPPGITQIWVAEGVYKPTQDTDRTIPFYLGQGLDIYGGFVGTESDLDQRNWVVNETILSGDIGTVGDHTDNSYHVVRLSVDDVVLDGFTISDGFASGTGFYSNGAGIHSYRSSSTVRNCRIVNNRANLDGGGMYIEDSTDAIINCYFASNTANTHGGGMYNEDSHHTVTNCIFAENHANIGGGMCSDNGSPEVTNSSFTDNTASQSGGGIYKESDGQLHVKNCIAWNNIGGNIDGFPGLFVTYSNVQGGLPGDGNIDTDPLFVTGPNDNYYLSHIAAGQSTDSPCIDAGDPNTPQEVLDILSGKTTRTDGVTDTGIVDMGYHYVP